MAADLTYTHDIRPLFRDQDIDCMKPRHILLGDQTWMCTPANAQKVYKAVESQFMPLDGPWPDDWVARFKTWMDQGYKP